MTAHSEYLQLKFFCKKASRIAEVSCHTQDIHGGLLSCDAVGTNL
jgi:hypothetical protein